MPPLKPLPERWWYGAPWKRTHPFRPMVRIYRCGDEHCNDTLLVGLPLLGSFTVRINKTIRLHGRCEQCIEELGPWCEGCQDCHEGPRCHPWDRCTHETKISACPACGGGYCPDCEPAPKVTCPHRGEKP